MRRAAPLAPAAFAAALLAALSIFRDDRFGSYGYDLGIFDQTVWDYSRFQIAANTVKRVPNLLGDHFHPILFTLAPLYWVWDDPRVLLVAQAVLIAASSIPLALWAERALDRRSALALQVAYLLFWGLLAGALFDFHEVAFAPLALSLALYGVFARRDWALVAGVAMGLAIKEDMALTMLALGIYVALVQRRRRLGLSIAIVSAAWFAVVIWVVMPELAGRSYGYSQGYDLVPVHLTDKLGTFADLLGAWLLLPLLSPLLLVAGPNLAEKLFTVTPSHWSTRYHYSLALAPILAFAAVDVLGRIKRRRPHFVLPLATGALLAGAVATFVVVQPFKALDGLISAAHADQIQDCLSDIPSGASVSATNALIPHLSHRSQIYPLYADRATKYLAIDTSTSLMHLTPRSTQRIVRHSLSDGYHVVCRSGKTLVLDR